VSTSTVREPTSAISNDKVSSEYIPKDDPASGEIKNAALVFESVWNKLLLKYGEDKLIFPKEIIWLMGAPGSGKGTNTPFILQARGITAEPVELSSLLDTPEFNKIKAEGAMISDTQVVEILMETLLQEKYYIGALVDGFPRTEIQVDIVSILYDTMLALKRKNPQKYPRPVFRMAVLFVEEKTSIERQLARGRRTALHNEKVLRTGIGELLPERPTDMSEKAAAKRYAIFKQHFDTLTTLQRRFPFHLINAQDSIEKVRARIITQFEYQSSLELDEQTFDSIERIPLASVMTRHARQNLVKRLDDYQFYNKALFQKVIEAIKEEFIPDIQQHALAGDVLIRTDNSLFESTTAVNMALDILSERGFYVSFDSKVERVPEGVDPKTFKLICTESKKYYFHVKFPHAVIRGVGGSGGSSESSSSSSPPQMS